MAPNSVSSNELNSYSDEENVAALLALVTFLMLIFAYCCWGSSCLRKLLSKTFSHRGDFEMSQDDRNVDVAQTTSSPTIILLPRGRVLVVDGTTLSRFHAQNSGLDLFELGSRVLQQERNRTARSDTAAESDRGTNAKASRPKAESPSPPSYESLFCGFQQTVPPSYAEVISNHTHPESSTVREIKCEEHNVDSTV